jgi:molybdopterin/thiamine biosynthesis adenylyltransferase
MTTACQFDYSQAFARNLGWVTDSEQAALRAKRIAIAGLGGVGGAHLLTLARLGIGRFAIADMDVFDLVNFNRQAGAAMSTVGRGKVEVLAEMARDINPELELRLFPRGVSRDNLDAFLDGADCYVDGLDYFAFAAREMVFAACAERRIPAVTAAPIGLGAALINFLPGRMSFEQYFRFAGASDGEKAVRFLAGLAPALLHRRYLVDPSRVDLPNQRGPSTIVACQLCAGVAAAQVLKILLKRGPLAAAPWSMQFDAYGDRMKTSWRPWGNANPLQRLLIRLGRRQYRVRPA